MRYLQRGIEFRNPRLFRRVDNWKMFGYPSIVAQRLNQLYVQRSRRVYLPVLLPPEDMRRITVWLDSCSPFYGVYEKQGGEAQLRGEIVKPTLE